ncbi:site-specific integrase [Chryseobacterium sp. MFBS3-17]|uniref:site-specific integrase n=1 Tax=Chryseobacterium sp. MFBS3-17 TaxID=2886689 RepID=UPI001D0DD9B0|nr:site-specific integrase [Chryseobacterium sp. MFBS3-17]MCC2590037.1 site-specific integrase [Chryseobacterium sp. MFBS3-17]
MNIKYHSQFLLDKEKGKHTAKIRYRIKWEGNVVAFSLGYRVEIEKWSRETQRCKANTTHGTKKVSASLINRKIQKYETACEKVFQKCELEGFILREDNFRELFNAEIGNAPKKEIKIEKLFFDVYDEFTKEESVRNQWTKSTEGKMQTIKKHLTNFNADVTFDYFSEEGLLNYQLFLQNTLKFKNSTILKNFSFLKWFLKWATKKKYNKNDAFVTFKPRLKTTQKKIIFLTPLELKKLKEFKIPKQKKYLNRVRDVFLFQCFTGLRYSDVANLKKSDVKDGFIEITTVKTSDSLIIELNNHSKALLRKYEKVEALNNQVFPVITNQKMNEYLKELAELAEIDEPVRQTYYRGNQRIDEVTPKYALLGTHAGRRTFICNALSLGIAPQVVMKWTGHSDYKAMKPYIDIADETKISAMEKFNLL